jgi:hypothetical protein
MLFNVEAYQNAMAVKFLENPSNKAKYQEFLNQKGISPDTKWPEEESARMNLAAEMMNFLYQHCPLPTFTKAELDAFMYDETKIKTEEKEEK